MEGEETKTEMGVEEQMDEGKEMLGGEDSPIKDGGRDINMEEADKVEHHTTPHHWLPIFSPLIVVSLSHPLTLSPSHPLTLILISPHQLPHLTSPTSCAFVCSYKQEVEEGAADDDVGAGADASSVTDQPDHQSTSGTVTTYTYGIDNVHDYTPFDARASVHFHILFVSFWCRFRVVLVLAPSNLPPHTHTHTLTLTFTLRRVP